MESALVLFAAIRVVIVHSIHVASNGRRGIFTSTAQEDAEMTVLFFVCHLALVDAAPITPRRVLDLPAAPN